MSTQEFLELARAERDGSWRVYISADAEAVVVVLADLLGSDRPGGKQLMSRRYARPADKTPGECLAAMLSVLVRAASEEIGKL